MNQLIDGKTIDLSGSGQCHLRCQRSYKERDLLEPFSGAFPALGPASGASQSMKPPQRGHPSRSFFGVASQVSTASLTSLEAQAGKFSPMLGMQGFCKLVEHPLSMSLFVPQGFQKDGFCAV